MSEWYYAHGGQQKGPVPISELQRLAGTGEFDPEKDLVWREGMPDWTAGAGIPEIAALARSAEATPAAPADPSPGGTLNPYAAPMSAEPQAAAAPGSPWEEIVPGSQPIEVGTCISRGFELMKRNLGMVIAVVVIYFGISWAVGMVLGMIEGLAGGGFQPQFTINPETGELDSMQGDVSPGQVLLSLITNLISQVISIFLGLGMIRIGLNIVDGRPFALGMIFGEGGKLLRAVGAGILYGLMVAVGLLLLIVPGIYLALRFGQYQNAIVERDMGVFEAFTYSSNLTTNNRMNLLGLGILGFLIMLAGLIALCVGIIFAYPIVWLAGIVAYRWMQYGPRVATDAA